MQFATLFASAAALAMGTNAAAIQRDTHVADFRVFGEAGCIEQNLGVWTVLDTDFYNDECKSLNPYDESAIKSLRLGNINNGCTMYIYTDDECKEARRAISVGQCNDAEVQWKSWSMHCATDANGN